jgi:DNA replication and repair protein RecF
VRVDRLRAVSFRCYESLDAELGAGTTLVAGPNGAGKTSLLEALHVALQGSSPRTSSDARCIRAGAEFLRVEAAGEQGGRPARTSVAIARGEPRRITVDGAPVRSAEALLERWACIVFLPERLDVVKRAPALRRAYVDRAVARLWPAFAHTAAVYASALEQRTALLRRIRAGHARAEALDPWDEQLAQAGAVVIAARRRFCTRSEPLFRERLGQLGGRPEEAGLAYRSEWPDSADGLRAALAERRPRDLERLTTSAGPHLDDVELREQGRELRAFGSQGEQRTAVLALLLAEAALLAETRGEPPVLLLDDVLSELDPGRRERLLALLPAHGQAIVTATEADGAGGVDRVLQVRDGRLTAA